MKHSQIGPPARVPLCRYAPSRLSFRGPKRRLDQDYIAFLGGAETFGRFIDKPFPTLLEDALGLMSINLGCLNAGVDVFHKDSTVLQICRGAQAVVMEVVGAQNISNRFYTVHPRRNDRFLAASPALQALYDEVDFSEFSFTRHMLSTLARIDSARFESVIEEVQTAWSRRMVSIAQEIERPFVLFWFAKTPPADTTPDREPLFITEAMLEELQQKAGVELVSFCPSEKTIEQGHDEMIFGEIEETIAAEMLGSAAHRQASAHLVRSLRRLLDDKGGPSQKERPALKA